MKNGYIKLHRKMMDNKIVWKDNDHLGVWMYLLFEATHKEIKMIFKGEQIVLKAGQLITGRKSMAKHLGIHESKIQRILSFFEKNKIIEQLRGNNNRLITILKWSAYQNNEQLMNNCRTTDEHKQECKEYKEIYNEHQNFEKIWTMYPNKKGKDKALKKYLSLKDVSDETIIKGIENYISEIKYKKIEQRYIKHGSTWFNGECWKDDYDVPQVKEKRFL